MTTPTSNPPTVGEMFRSLVAATEGLIQAEAEYVKAFVTSDTIVAPAINLARAQLVYARARLAVRLANGTVAPGAGRIISIEHQHGADWVPLLGGDEQEARRGETASAQALRVAIENDLASSDLTWRVLVWTDPRPDAAPDGEWTNLTDRATLEPVAA